MGSEEEKREAWKKLGVHHRPGPLTHASWPGVVGPIRALGVDLTPSVIEGVGSLLGPELRSEVGRPAEVGFREPQAARDEVWGTHRP